MEFVLQKLPAQVKGLSLLIRDPAAVYWILGLYGVLTILLLVYVRFRFRAAARTLKMLQSEWQNAESSHAAFVGIAQEKLSKWMLPPPTPAAALARTGSVGLDMRTQIVGMAKRGIPSSGIARTCGMKEGEIEVILGMARLQK